MGSRRSRSGERLRRSQSSRLKGASNAEGVHSENNRERTRGERKGGRERSGLQSEVGMSEWQAVISRNQPNAASSSLAHATVPHFGAEDGAAPMPPSAIVGN